MIYAKVKAVAHQIDEVNGMHDYIVLTADDEDPICDRCDNCNNTYEYCSQNCGAENWWNGYKRTDFNNSNGDIK